MKVEGTPADFGHELLQPNLDRVELAFERIPALERAGITTVVNGPFTFDPDGNPMFGPVPGTRNYWVAAGVMAGFCQVGGVGLCLAEWMIDAAPSFDVSVAHDTAHVKASGSFNGLGAASHEHARRIAPQSGYAKRSGRPAGTTLSHALTRLTQIVLDCLHFGRPEFQLPGSQFSRR